MVRKTLLLLCGWVCVALGLLGAFLPLLPTTPFLLLASACFMRGSPKLNHWLLNHPKFGPILHNWHHHRAVSKQVKRRANIMIVASFALSIYLVPLLWHKAMLVTMLVVLLVWFNRLPERDNPSPQGESL
ncbi:YbaN family protein [Photobacterium rosenbergii]|uniref:YbaN family protein n=1 Tax=Photobacterium rosenbergii TaxID=294936 RepID=UPI001C9952BB|nr:YbaN family protein [Photobacterium rosenbergii]MBY5949046.1 YbaN family protein [Photobacterium rosenbergii]